MNPVGFIQPWLVSADDGSLSDIINSQDPRGTRTLPKPKLQSEHQAWKDHCSCTADLWPGGDISAETTTEIIEVSRLDSLQGVQYVREVVELAAGEAYEDWIDEHRLKVPGWAEANVANFEDIQR